MLSNDGLRELYKCNKRLCVLVSA